MIIMATAVTTVTTDPKHTIVKHVGRACNGKIGMVYVPKAWIGKEVLVIVKDN